MAVATSVKRQIVEAERPRIAVLGLGFVGLPLALSFGLHDPQVCGVDIDEGLVERIRGGSSDLKEAHQGRTISAIPEEQIADGRFAATTDAAAALADAGAVLITVGLGAEGSPHRFRALEAAASAVARRAAAGSVAIFRPTVPP